tara:strand:+ start:1186 stop:5139 length:3954 start_codon:yes stop_codon:yes gene_type:complete
MVQSYRNTRKGFYTDCYQDTTPIGTVLPNLKSGANTYDHEFINKATNTHRLEDFSGNAYGSGDDPAYTHDGYLYCDGTEYNIKDYPALYEIIGVRYGGRASSGIDVVNGGSGYSTSDIVSISAPNLATGIQATAIVKSIQTIPNGAIQYIDVTNPGSGYTSAPTISVSGGNGATFSVRILNGTIQNITTANVMSFYGEEYLGTFRVPNTVTKKIVGNGPVFGQNSPTIGNISMVVGATGGAWYLDQDIQDDYFSLGKITTTGYDNVVETVGCTIIGSQKVTVTMEKKKLPSIFQHSHAVFHSRPGVQEWPAESHGDRYLQGYQARNGRISRWYPSTGTVLQHSHALLRQPITNNTIATYDFMDYKGGDGNVGALKDIPDAANATGGSFQQQPGYTSEIPYDDQYYLASGAANSGSFEFQTTIPNPTLLKLISSSKIGGRQVTTGGVPIYDYSQEWEFVGVGSYTIPISSVVGAPDQLIYTLVGGGGSGAAGTFEGNDGQDSTITAGSTLVLTAGGGKKGGAAQGVTGGAGGAGGAATESGSLTPTAAISGNTGQQGQNGEFLEANQPTDPGGGGTGGVSASNSGAGAGSDGCRVLLGGLSGTYNSTLTSDGSFTNLPTSGGLTSVTFELRGGKGGDGVSRGSSTTENNKGGYGAKVNLELAEAELSGFLNAPSPGWNVVIGYGGSGRNGGTNSLNSNGGFGGEGASGRHGGGGGAVTCLRRGTQIVAGAGGGGGGGADGGEGSNDNNSPGQAGGAYPGGAGLYTGLQSSSSGTISSGSGGQGGRFGCVGGGGGAGGGGVSSGGTLGPGGGYGGGGAPGGPGGTPGGWGGHQGGVGGQQGISEYKSNYFASGNLSEHSDTDGSVNLTIQYNANKWTAAGGGGGSGSQWFGSVPWNDLGNPATINVTVGAGGDGKVPGGNNAGQTSDGGGGYAKIGVGTITGYTGGTVGTTTGDVIESASQTPTVWDVSINSDGNGTGTGGNFRLPSTQVPTVLFRGGGKSSDGTTTANGYNQANTGHATATATVTGGTVTGVTLGDGGTGYTEQPYVYLLHGAGSGSYITSQFSNVSVTGVTLGGTGAPYTHFVKFGGAGTSTNRDRFIVLKAQDTSAVNYFGIKACRGNGVNGGDVPEESLVVEYQLAGSTTWTLIDSIINASAERTDPLSGMIVPACGQGESHDGASGDTQWYTYSVVLPSAAKAPATKIRLYQERSEQGGQDHSAGGDFDHYGICEFIYFREKTTELVFVPSSGAIKRNTVDFLEYNVEGEVGPSVTYSSGLGCSDATMTLKSTTKIEPQATIDPDYDVPLITPYVTCKYLIKAF